MNFRGFQDSGFCEERAKSILVLGPEWNLYDNLLVYKEIIFFYNEKTPETTPVWSALGNSLPRVQQGLLELKCAGVL